MFFDSYSSLSQEFKKWWRKDGKVMLVERDLNGQEILTHRKLVNVHKLLILTELLIRPLVACSSAELKEGLLNKSVNSEFFNLPSN